MVNERRWLASIFTLYFILALGYSLLMPVWEAPDEPAHYHLAWHLAQTDKYPTLKHNYESNQPRAYYYLASWLIRGLDKVNPLYSIYDLPDEYKSNIRIPERRFDWNSDNYRFLLGVHVLRWINILIGALALWLNWKAVKLIAPDKPAMRLAAQACAALTPQFLHIMSSVSNDAPGTLAGALLFYLALRITKGITFPLVLVSVVFAAVLPLLTKLTVLPVSAAYLVVLGWKWFASLRQKRWLLLSALMVLISAGILYFTFPETIRTASGEVTWRLSGLREDALTFEYLKFILRQITWTYWGQVGWLAVGLPAWIYTLLTVLGG
jgi:hypothetical protein